MLCECPNCSRFQPPPEAEEKECPNLTVTCSCGMKIAHPDPSTRRHEGLSPPAKEAEKDNLSSKTLQDEWLKSRDQAVEFDKKYTEVSSLSRNNGFSHKVLWMSTDDFWALVALARRTA